MLMILPKSVLIVLVFYIKLNNVFPESALSSLYYTLFLSHINYGITAWSSANSVDKNRQKHALRVVSNSEYRSHSNLKS